MAKMIGHGVTLHVGPTASSTAIGNILSIGGPNQARDSIDVSDAGSTNKFREFIPGLLNAGEMTVEVVFEDDKAAVLQGQLTATADTWTITFADSSSFKSAGLITALGWAIPFDDKVAQSVTIKLSGEPTFATAA